ncbi:Z1 domain-containing protein [Microbacterium sulfonylureivorans]|uniref:Z1 domain-containing protein n=1 Tax=Microbacterium sulfonylureivorans TaxID=2486854 RepID=UPI000FD7F707|nr:Z1 domain-containing protein [Microbacterium sulfonylureivorans]
MSVQLSAEAETLLMTLNAMLRKDEALDLTALKNAAEGVRPFVAAGIDDDEFHTVIARAVEMNAIVLRVGDAIVDPNTYDPWLEQRRPNTEVRRSSAYQELLLSRGWAGNVVETLDEQTDLIVDLVGDPQKPAPWRRRGLAIGEVQSGKTSSYIGVLAKAIDYGYKIIVVIGGHTEDLRRQTQARLDSDLTGVDSAYLADNIIVETDVARIGIGRVDQTLSSSVNVLTTTRSDFSAHSKRAGNVALGGETPTIFVIKKNAKVMQNLATYLRAHIPNWANQPPLIVIDDEADWASINVNSRDDVSAVNQAIRDILAASNRNSYLGITATPFANVFIDDEVEEDIFPRDYILALESPSNYQGVGKYFSDASHPALVSDVADTLTAIPYSHKRTLQVSELPDSIRRAIATFFVGTAIRRERDGQPKAASMLINVSRFNDVQSRVAELVGRFVDELVSTVLSDFGIPEGARGRNERSELLHAAHAQHFDGSDVNWLTVRRQLLSFADEFQVQLINSQTKAEREKHTRETPKSVRDAESLLPTIYVGGDVLARGLTIEGLQVSYYSRRAAAADTLLQMGRWFGYRPGYEDLVRLWIDDDTAELFRWTADISAELRESLSEMKGLGLTPAQFGLKIRRHPEGFQIAAARKMRDAVDHDGVISINGRVFESTTLSWLPEDRSRNLEALRTLLSVLGPAGRTQGKRSVGDPFWQGVDRRVVAEFLSSFRSYVDEPYFGGSARGRGMIVQNLAEIKNGDSWDIALISGSGGEVRSEGIPIGHSASVRNQLKVYTTAGSGPSVEFPNRRVAAGQDLVSVIPRDNRILSDDGQPILRGDRAVARESLTRPTMLLYTVVANTDHEEPLPEGLVRIELDNPLIAVVVATPKLTVEEEYDELINGRGVRWKVNRVYARRQLGMSMSLDDDADEDEDA